MATETLEFLIALRPTWPGNFHRTHRGEVLEFSPGQAEEVSIGFTRDKNERAKVDPIAQDIGPALCFVTLDAKGRAKCEYDLTNEFRDAILSGDPIQALHEAHVRLTEIAESRVTPDLSKAVPESDVEGQHEEGDPETVTPAASGDDPKVPEGDVLVVDSQIPRNFHEALIKAGIDTLAKLDAYLAQHKTVTNIPGIKVAGEKAIKEALEAHAETPA